MDLNVLNTLWDIRTLTPPIMCTSMHMKDQQEKL